MTNAFNKNCTFHLKSLLLLLKRALAGGFSSENKAGSDSELTG